MSPLIPLVEFPLGTMLFWSPTMELRGVPVKVCGIASAPLPVLGRTYIVELAYGPIDNYPYTHVAAFECHLSTQRI